MNSNIMSLGGIAIAIGAMVDAAIVMIENAHKHLERLRARSASRAGGDDRRLQGGRAGAVLLACSIITVSFLPVFTLEAQEGRLFSPLAYTKTFSMAGAALLSITLVPVLMLLFIRGNIMPEAKNPLNRFLIWRLPADHRLGDALEEDSPSSLALVALAVTAYPGAAARHRVHADAERGHAALHARLAAGHVGDQGGRSAADPGQDHQELSRKWPRCTARPGARRPPPIRRRWRCSRP